MEIADKENRYIVRSVRGTMRDKIGRVRPASREYRLTDLAFGNSILAGCDYQYQIELGMTREIGGYLVGEQGCQDDPLQSYGLVQLTSGEIFEFERQCHPEFKLATFPPRDSLGITTIRHQGDAIGECRAAGLGSTLGIHYENAWDLTWNGQYYGRIDRPEFCDEELLHIVRPGGSRIPLIIKAPVPLFNLYHELQAILDFLFGFFHPFLIHHQRSPFFRRPRQNIDRIIPPKVAQLLNEEETVYYFAVSLLFRLHFDLIRWHRHSA